MLHRKRSFFRYSLLAILLLSLVQCKTGDEPEFLFRAAVVPGEDHTWSQAFVYLGEILEERSKGRIKIEVYPSEQLAKEMEAIRLIKAEVIDMTTTGSTLSNWNDIMVFCELPFLFKDSTEMKHVVDGFLGKRIDEEMINEAGLRPLGYFLRGNRHLTSNRPIKHPDDLKGLIIRVPNVPSFVTAWSVLGAKPTPMALSEVFTSLQQGTIEAQENPFAMIKDMGFAEVQDYLNLTSHVVSWVYPVIGEKQFQKLPPDLKKIFLEAAEDMIQYENKLFIENEKKVQEELKARGMEFIEVDKEAFVQKSEKGIYDSLSPEMQEVYHQIRAQLKDMKGEKAN